MYVRRGAIFTLSLHACMLIEFYIHLHAYSLNALLRIRLWATTHCPCLHVCSFNFMCAVNSSHVVVTFLYVKEICNFYTVLACMHAYSILHPLACSLNAWLVLGSNRIGLWVTSSRSVGFLSNTPPKWSIRGHPGRPPRRHGLKFLIHKIFHTHAHLDLIVPYFSLWIHCLTLHYMHCKYAV
jgi:hypothetical protein